MKASGDRPERRRRVFRLMIGSLGALGGPGGRFRHTIERMVPEHYLSSQYYERWLTGVTTMAVESGFATPEELERRAGGRFPLSRADRGVLPEDLNPRTEPRYAVGDDVRVRAWHPSGHTRARYVQGRRGTVVRVDGAFDIDDIEAHGVDPSPTPSTPCASGQANCGAKPAAMVKSCTSTCSSATSRIRNDG